MTASESLRITSVLAIGRGLDPRAENLAADSSTPRSDVGAALEVEAADFHWLPDLARALDGLEGTAADLVLIDLDDSTTGGLEGLRSLRSRLRDHSAPLIGFTSDPASDHAIAAVQAGAQEICSWELGDTADLLRRLRQAVVREGRQSNLERELARERELGERDPLTGLLTRYRFESWLEAALDEGARRGRGVSVLLVDLDRFKQINDSLGHAVGDQVLRAVAERIRPHLCAEDAAARIGADLFAIGIASVDGPEDGQRLAERLRAAVAQPHRIAARNGVGAQELVLTASIGLSSFPEHGGDAETLLRHADSAVGGAKTFGGDSLQAYKAPVAATPLERLSLEADLRRALETDELSLHFQPLVDGESGKIIGSEALARWQHDRLGMVPPATFIPLAEDTGLIEPIGRWVLQAACEQAATWQRAGLPNRTVSINVSPRQFWHAGFRECVEETLAEAGVSPEKLVLEITESCLLRDLETTRTTLEALQSIGVRVSIDDFGTGYSSFSVLRELPLDTLKIDRSFVAPALEDPGAALIASAIISLGSGLGLDVVAEGVETQEQREFLLEAGCTRMQGYLFSPPLAPDAFTQMLTRGAPLPPAKADEERKAKETSAG